MAKAKALGMRSALFAVAASALLASCGGGGDGTAPVPMGQLRVALTDAPGCGFDQVNVTVERVRVHQSSSAGEGEAGWSDIAIVGGPRKMDLLALNNGVIAELGQVTLPAGQYQQIRLVLSRNTGGMGMIANSVVPTGSMSEMPLDTPSGSQSGIKLIHGFTVEPNKLTDVLLDFDACRSIVLRSNGTHSMKPVISVLPRTGTAIAGVVDPSMANVTVSAQRGGKVLRATRPTLDGRFLLAPVPVDPNQTPYDVVFTAPDRTTMVVTNVPVILDKVTTVNSAPGLILPTSASGTVTGAVSPVAAAATGSVRALQVVGTVPVVEVAHVNVDPLTGDYSLLLPTAAPMLASHSTTTPPALTFVSQAGPGQYTLEASATGYVTKLGSEITVPAGATLPLQDFMLSAP